MPVQKNQPPNEDRLDADVVLIGGGIMSATLGSMLAVLQPDWRIVLVERASKVASESSGPWNNAGTGHSGFCELNYMPDPANGSKPATIAGQFLVSRQWWAHLAETGLVDPNVFIHSVPHMDVVFGAKDIEYLRQRYETLRRDPLFAGMSYSEDPTQIAEWAPLLAEGRQAGEQMAATWHPEGTDIDFGALTEQLTRIIAGAHGQVLCGHEVRSLRRADDGGWTVAGRAGTRKFTIHSQRVFVGAGGNALRLLQQARLPEVRGYGVFPIGAGFLRSSEPSVASRHHAKLYSQADLGAPPMSVPHLDKRVVNGAEHLMFGPYATFSTKLLKNGRLTDFFTTLRWHNMHVLAAAALQSLPLVRYLITELASTKRARFRKLQRLYPDAVPSQWEFIHAGQRAQLVTPDKKRIGALRQGTETVVSDDGTIAGLLGASPGASTAVPIMLDLLRRSFPNEWRLTWRPRLSQMMPGLNPEAEWDVSSVSSTVSSTSRSLKLQPRSGQG